MIISILWEALKPERTAIMSTLIAFILVVALQSFLFPFVHDQPHSIPLCSHENRLSTQIFETNAEEKSYAFPVCISIDSEDMELKVFKVEENEYNADKDDIVAAARVKGRERQIWRSHKEYIRNTPKNVDSPTNLMTEMQADDDEESGPAPRHGKPGHKHGDILESTVGDIIDSEAKIRFQRAKEKIRLRRRQQRQYRTKRLPLGLSGERETSDK